MSVALQTRPETPKPFVPPPRQPIEVAAPSFYLRWQQQQIEKERSRQLEFRRPTYSYPGVLEPLPSRPSVAVMVTSLDMERARQRLEARRAARAATAPRGYPDWVVTTSADAWKFMPAGAMGAAVRLSTPQPQLILDYATPWLASRFRTGFSPAARLGEELLSKRTEVWLIKLYRAGRGRKLTKRFSHWWCLQTMGAGDVGCADGSGGGGGRQAQAWSQGRRRCGAVGCV